MLACAVTLTIVLLVASFVRPAGDFFADSTGALHWGAHIVLFAILAITWRGGLPHVSAVAIALAVIAFGFAQEAIEIVGHGHAYEWADAIVDSISAIIGISLARLAWH